MKKALLGTTAIVMIGTTAAPASAVEWTVRVGGYSEQYAAWAEVDADFTTNAAGDFVPGNGDFSGIDEKQESEIWFLPKITLDNGLEIGANIQLEGFTNSDQIDESHLFIDGSFGEIVLGSENSAGYKMTWAAPDVTFLNVNSGSTTFFVPWSAPGVGADTFRRTLGTSFIEAEGNNDAQRLTYFSPRFAGFQVGVSYARDGTQDNNSQIDTSVTDTLHDIFDFGANYVNSFGDFEVAVSGRYGIADVAGQSDDPELWSAGINLGYAGFTVGGSFAEQNNTSSACLCDGEYFDVGASYVTGPWGFSFTFARGVNEDNDGTSQDEELEQYLAGINYDLAKGVRINAFGAYIDFDNAEGGTNVGDVDGWVAGTGVRIDF